MDLTGKESLDWMGHGYVEAADTDSDEVSITGRVGTLPDDVDRILDDLLSDHDVAGYPEGAVIGRFQTNDIQSLQLRTPEDINADPVPDHFWEKLHPAILAVGANAQRAGPRVNSDMGAIAGISIDELL